MVSAGEMSRLGDSQSKTKNKYEDHSDQYGKTLYFFLVNLDTNPITTC